MTKEDLKRTRTYLKQGGLFLKNDGGRDEAGYKGLTGDCACRAIAIAAEIPYQSAYDLINTFGKKERASKNRKRKSHARTGVYTTTFHKIMKHLGFEWTPTMQIGQGCTVHVKASELPKSGRLILNLSRHFAAFIDGNLHDTYDCSREGTRCVYGYWHKPQAKRKAKHKYQDSPQYKEHQAKAKKPQREDFFEPIGEKIVLDGFMDWKGYTKALEEYIKTIE